MKVEIALGFISTYGAILSIIVLYQTLVLQAVLDRTDRSERDYAGPSERERAQRVHRARVHLMEGAAFIVGVTVAFLLVAGYSDTIAALVDPTETPRGALTYATGVLRVLYLAVTLYYAWRIVRHPFIWQNFFRRESSSPRV